MSIDFERLHAIFFEESFEGLDALEAGLLNLDAGDRDPETLNAIFRAAHSIKGGAGTFGFQDVANVTHALETLLDQLREGEREVSAELITTLLESVDGLRELLTIAKSGEDADPAFVQGLRGAFEKLLGETPAAPAVESEESPCEATAAEQGPVQGWEILFQPHEQLFMTGNDPLRILAELQRVGDTEIEALCERLPELEDMDAEKAYIGWKIRLQGEICEEAVREIFAWVEDDCDLSITALAAAAPEVSDEPAATTEPEQSKAEPAKASNKPTVVKSKASSGESSIRVSVDKVDSLINLVGELVITQAMLKQMSTDLDPGHHEQIMAGLENLERNTRELQEAVMSVRMLPMQFVFSRFPRVVRDAAGKLGKQVALKTEGEGTELDKGVIEKITDPLTHIVRNAVDHGIESPEVRKAAGKPESGQISLKAAHQGGHIVIEVSDDGGGLNRDKIIASARKNGIEVDDNISDEDAYQLIFAPGLSTAAEVTDLSGRGVGMDVVRKNILGLGGQVHVTSAPGKGSKVSIRLPLTLAILDGMSVKVGKDIFIVPLNYIIESLQPEAANIKTIAGTQRVIHVRGEYLPLMSLHNVYNTSKANADNPLVVLLESDGRKLAVEVDELLGQQQVVIKNLENNYRRVHGVAGATILGDGRVALIVDVPALTEVAPKAA